MKKKFKTIKEAYEYCDKNKISTIHVKPVFDKCGHYYIIENLWFSNFWKGKRYF